MEQNRVCCLYRVSTDKQVDYDNNHEADIPMQRKACHRFADKMGWNIVYEEQEDGVSGHKVRAENRDKIQIIKDLALKGKFDILLVFMFDRIGRIADETPFVVEWFAKNGIRVWSTQEGEQRFDNHIDKLLNYIRFWQADGESEKTSIRTRTSLGQMVEEGHYKGGTAPIGYVLEKSGRFNKRKHELYDLKVKEDDAKIVRLIFDKYVKEGYGVQKIANYLNDNGYPNPTGNRWSHNTIRNILQNATYVGILRSGETRSPYLPELQIVSQQIFDKAQQIRRERAEAKENTPRVPINMRGNSLLSGNVFCGHCGSRLHLTTTSRYYTKADGTVIKKRRVRYACYKKVRKMVNCDGQSGYSAAKLDGLVEKIIKNIFIRLRGISKSEMISKRYDKELSLRKSNLKKAKSDLAKEQEKLSKLREEVIKSIQGESAYSQELLSELVNETEEKVREFERLCTAAEREVEENQILMKELSDSYDEIMSWANLYDSASIEQKKMIVNSMIQRIEVYYGYDLHVEFTFAVRQFYGDKSEEELASELLDELPETA
jgi:DNA invertase Pin-like site-specific DNA recombinase/Skp family chaperone for outer membrane proteins